MYRALFAAALLSVLPATSFSMMGGRGYHGPIRVTGPGGFAADEEDYAAALRLLQKGNYGGAIPLLRRVLQVQQGDPDVLTYLGFSERMLGNYANSLDYYQRALARNPDHKGARVYLGELYLAMHQPDQARAQLAELVRLCPDGCVEEDALAQAIVKSDAATPPAPPAAAAQTPPAAPAK